MRPYPVRAYIAVAVVAVIGAQNAHAQWSDVPISTAIGDQYHASMAGDGAGGAVIVWEDTRANPASSVADIYAQRINGSGVVQWTANGIPVCTATNWQSEAHVVPDGAGGWMVLWGDCRAGCAAKRIYAQRLNGSGVPLWATDGIPASSGLSASPGNIDVASDGAGGAIVVWADWGSATPGVYAQRLYADGTRWGADVLVCSQTRAETNPRVVSDGGGGWVVAWQDDRLGGTARDIYAQRLGPTGAVQWIANGVAVTSSHVAGYPRIVTSVSGDVVIVWGDARFGNGRAFGQRLNTSGVTQWMSGGVQLSDVEASSQYGPFVSLASDGAGGVILGWSDQYLGSYYIVAQRVDLTGTLQWTSSGVLVWPKLDDGQLWPTYPAGLSAVLADGSGGAILLSADARGDSASPPDTFNVYAQRLNGAGTSLWLPNGVPVSWLPASKSVDNLGGTAIPDGTGGVLFTMTVRVAGGALDLYAGRLVGGRVDVGAPPSGKSSALRIEGIRPNPARDRMVLTVSLPTAAPLQVELLDIGGRRLLSRPFFAESAGQIVLRLPEVASLAPGIYFVRIAQAGQEATCRVCVMR